MIRKLFYVSKFWQVSSIKINPIKQGTGPKGPYSVYIIDGQKYTLAYGKNGFVVSFYPSK